MKICYVATTTHISKNMGDALGSTTHTMGAAKALCRHGHEVILVSDMHEGDGACETIEGVKVYRLLRGIFVSSGSVKRSGANFLLKRLNPLSALVLGIRIAEIVRKEGCDAILERSQSGAAGAVASYVTGRPMLLELIDNLQSRLSLSRAQMIFTYTPAMLGGRFGEKTVVVDSGYDGEIFRPRKAKAEYDLCYAGSFKEWDGLEDLVEAAAILHNPKLRFLLVGDGVNYAGIRRLAKIKNVSGNFCFTGKVALAEVPALIARARVCIAPFNIRRTKKGGFEKYGYYFSPLKLYEYIACGKPIITADYPIIRKTFSERNGALFREGSVEALAEAIKSTLERKDLGAIGRRNLEYSKRFTWFEVIRPIAAGIEMVCCGATAHENVCGSAAAAGKVRGKSPEGAAK
ncbi:MAG: glycosyltransferase [Candidatus Diapherotrites archaeon]